MKEPQQFDLPWSEAKHNPIWCGGDAHGQCCTDDPCWACIAWAFERLKELSESLSKCPDCGVVFEHKGGCMSLHPEERRQPK
jgi:hypothetical protein